MKNLRELSSRIRWRALKAWGCSDKEGVRPTKKEYYGLKTAKLPSLLTKDDFPHFQEEVKLFKEFEDQLFGIPRKVNFKPYDNDLQKQMRPDMKKVKQGGRVVVKGDKKGTTIPSVQPSTTR